MMQLIDLIGPTGVGALLIGAFIYFSAIAPLVKSSQKHKKSRRKLSTDEAWPASTDMQRTRTASPQPSKIKDGNRRSPEIVRATEPQQPHGMEADDPMPAVGIEAAEIGNEESTETLAEFDLRRAILYSEILKPRYDTYDKPSDR